MECEQDRAERESRNRWGDMLKSCGNHVETDLDFEIFEVRSAFWNKICLDVFRSINFLRLGFLRSHLGTMIFTFFTAC